METTTMSRFRELRDRAGLSQGDLARLLGVDKTTIQRWESAAAQPLHRHRKALAEHLHCGLDEFATRLHSGRGAAAMPPQDGRKAAAPRLRRVRNVDI